MNHEEIRRAFLDFFVERGHLELRGLPLVPADAGITTLFTIAGMQQMIPYFLGREEPPHQDMVTVQKAVRTNDIEEVGDDTHLTYLEMLGNFSVGHYFKREAIAYTWEFLTGTLQIPADRWWATYYPGDTDARDAWLAAGLAPERIGETEENWWGPPGPYGPCGPDSEIHYDRGPEFGCGRSDCRPENECCDRFVEIWNNVFMQYYQDEQGERRPLPWNNIDTGMGFERLVAIVQDVRTPYETDLFLPIIQSVTNLTGTAYGVDSAVDRSLRIISDHIRAVTFLISDGVMPSSEGRGYVVRRLLRRAALHGRLQGLDKPFLSAAVETVIELMTGYHAELAGQRERILDIVQREERKFLQTLTRGLSIFEEMAQRAVGNGQQISGQDAFVLYDTHGFPLELTAELAEARGLAVDRAGFAESLAQQQALGREKRFTHAIGASPETFTQIAETVPPTRFTGYDELQTTTEIVAILAEGKQVMRAEAGDEVEVILASTPFYAESGGQVGDTGTVRSDSGAFRVTDTKRPYAAYIVHSATVEEGALSVGDLVSAEVDTVRRLHILPHHSGTHLVHKALQEVLGPEATQAGSLVAADRLRFDFRWPRPMTDEEVQEVQDRVNAAIWANLPVTRELKSYDEAVQDGAMALFGEKYGDVVRVVSMGDWSKELCGGTHVDATGDIGLLIITTETGIGSGVRRIEALAGAVAYAYVNELRDQLRTVVDTLETKPEHLVARAEQIVAENRELTKRLDALARKLADTDAVSLVQRAQTVGGLKVVAETIVADSVDYLQVATDAVKGRLERGAVALAADIGGKPAFTLALTRSARDDGFNAGAILREAVRQAQGGAGGNPDFAQGGGRDVSKIADVLNSVVELLRQRAEG